LVRMTWHAPKPENHGTSFHDSSIRDTAAGYTGGVFSLDALGVFRQHDEIFSSVFAYQSTGSVALGIHDETTTGTGEFVSGEYFRGLGIVPAAGRVLVTDDDEASAPPVVVLTAELADGRFGGFNAAIGHTLLINNTPFTIVGV